MVEVNGVVIIAVGSKHLIEVILVVVAVMALARVLLIRVATTTEVTNLLTSFVTIRGVETTGLIDWFHDHINF